ncbi:MAG: hypothetical protein L0241_30800 [Planctomycetia bacterium]|nr:hypothetical protein [Planctomycetia bacterium]
MKFPCLCGRILSNAGSPNNTEHVLLSSVGVERLQDLIAEQFATAQGKVVLWADSWEESGAIEVWKCSDCQRLYVSPKDGFDKVVVYKIEQVGI